MTAKEFIDRFGCDEARAVAQKANTNYAYFSQIAYGHRRPSVDLAKRLVDASENRLGFTDLLLVEKATA
ncbi:hypothetical protein [Gilvimarinus chinensis]|uniref:hypothetical protein n=1 Tax=Gilvimarinus chinensis TaxID=396005 RepID=UPI00036D9F00|nr:hypothetical protein [Gilvimarinus chinensis]